MSLTAAALRGVPPFGLGVYARDEVEPRPRWDFVCVNAWRTDAAAQAEAARRAGAAVWTYGTIEHFRPETWRAGLERLARATEQLDAEGLIVDPEGGWPQVGRAAWEREGAAFGAALAVAANSTRVGLTSYPSWPALDACTSAAGASIFGSIQIYGRSSSDPAAFASWWARWQARFGARLCLSIAGWNANGSMGTAATYREYLNKLPASPGAIVWDTRGSRLPSYIVDALSEYSPARGGRFNLAGALTVGASAARAPAVVLGLIVLVCLAALWWAR